MTRIRIAAAALAVAGACVGIFVASSFAANTVAAKPTVVSVTATEFHFKLSVTSIAKPGTVTFKVKNGGKEAHNFVFLSGINKGTVLIQPSKTKSLTVVFTKKGKYTYECTVGEHAEEGMLGTFTVK